MKINIDIGDTFGRLVVTEQVTKKESGWNKKYFECTCLCGTRIIVKPTHLKSGHTKSCGCLHRERLTERNTKHGLRYIPEYSVWLDIKRRCYNKKYMDYKYYGGRGITVCKRWLKSFSAFYSDMQKRPNGKYSIERINNNKNYTPSNCKWATHKEQTRNQRSNVLITHEGKTLCASGWSEITGIKAAIIRDRVKKGWPTTRILC